MSTLHEFDAHAVGSGDVAQKTAVHASLQLDRKNVLITAGGTREPIDPVRYIGNRSTGKMGVALAEAALARGADVTLIAASVEIPLPEAAQLVRVETAEQLRAALRDAMAADGGSRGAADALVMAAAVADFTPASPSDQCSTRRGRNPMKLNRPTRP